MRAHTSGHSRAATGGCSGVTALYFGWSGVELKLETTMASRSGGNAARNSSTGRPPSTSATAA